MPHFFKKRIIFSLLNSKSICGRVVDRRTRAAQWAIANGLGVTPRWSGVGHEIAVLILQGFPSFSGPTTCFRSPALEGGKDE